MVGQDSGLPQVQGRPESCPTRLDPSTSEGMTRLVRRLLTRRPVGHAPFAELFPEADAHRLGAYPTLGAFTGLLRDEPGRAYAVAPTNYATPPTQPHRDGVGYVTREPARRLYALAGGTVLGSDGVVYDPASRHVVRETLEQWDAPIDRHPVFASPPTQPAEHLPGVSLSLGTLGGSGFYHFLLESLPKLALARDLLPACDHVLVPGDGEGWRRGWLQAFEVDPQRVRWLAADAHYRCDQLLFTGRLVRHFEPNPWAVAALRAVVSPPARPAGGTLWLDRSGVANRRVTWEADLHRRLPTAAAVDLGRLTPAKAAETCGGAAALAGLHGAAFANMVFCRPGTRVVEFLPELVAPWYARLAAVCGHRHLAVFTAADQQSQTEAAAATAEFLAGG